MRWRLAPAVVVSLLAHAAVMGVLASRPGATMPRTVSTSRWVARVVLAPEPEPVPVLAVATQTAVPVPRAPSLQASALAVAPAAPVAEGEVDAQPAAAAASQAREPSRLLAASPWLELSLRRLHQAQASQVQGRVPPAGSDIGGTP